MNNDWFKDMLNPIMEKLWKINLEILIIILMVVLLFSLWCEIPNPCSIEITPLKLLEDYSATSNKQVFQVKVMDIPCEFSLLGEATAALGTTSKTLGMLEKIKGMASAANSIRYKNETITVPDNAGMIKMNGVSIYHWNMTYQRFLIKEELYQKNILIISNGEVFYLYGGRKKYFSLNIELKSGKVR